MECGVEVEVEVEVESDSAEDDGLRFGDGNQILWKTKVAVELRNQFLKGGRTMTWAMKHQRLVRPGRGSRDFKLRSILFGPLLRPGAPSAGDPSRPLFPAARRRELPVQCRGALRLT
jgi:hypothetical protein